MKLESVRNEYKYATLSEEQMPENPLLKFDQWLNEAIDAKVTEPNSMSVSTIGEDGFPQSRIVLLKDYSDTGFTFFTNYESDKGHAIKNNPVACLLIFWPDIERQIRITGYVEKTTDEISDHYFQSRPILSQAAAITSNQSKKISSRNALENRFNELIKKIPENHFSRPKNWGGFLVKPLKIEFWQGRENRLHDRILYEKTDENWQFSRLEP